MEFVFDGGRPSIDLVNTLRDRHLGGRELLADPAALVDWLTVAGLLDRRVRASAEQLDAARDLREAVDRLACGGRRAADVRLLNSTAEGLPIPQLRFDGDAPGLRARSAAGPVAAALALLAVDAIELVAAGAQVRICAFDDCGLRFVDGSPQHNRQWCSMSRCGNRAKARAHYARQKPVG